jgi:protein-disulfide isomerase
MTQEVKIILGISITTLAILFVGVFLTSDKQIEQANASGLITKNAKHKITASNAKVTLVEFADFQCPACARTHPVINQILNEYKGKITFIYRHFPLPQHQNAILAAKVSEAAGEQGKFWEMYNVLYDKQSLWSENNNASEIFIDFAKELKLNTASFKDAVNSNTFNETIQKDKDDAATLGINSTPTLFINNKKVTEFPTYENLKKLVEEHLK